MNIEEAIKVMEHWIEYEKNNKEKINRADELINIQETILSAYKRVLKENEILENEILKKDKEYEELTEASKELCKTVNLMKKVINEIAEYTEIDAIFKIKQQQILQELLGDK